MRRRSFTAALAGTAWSWLFGRFRARQAARISCCSARDEGRRPDRVEIGEVRMRYEAPCWRRSGVGDRRGGKAARCRQRAGADCGFQECTSMHDFEPITRWSVKSRQFLLKYARGWKTEKGSRPKG